VSAVTGRRSRGITLIEVLISMAILLIGVLAVVFFFPQTLQNAANAEYRSKAAVLAQMKAEEIRRDDDTTHTLIAAIASLQTPTAPITFPQDPNLAYQFSGRTILYEGETPAGDPGVARVIVRYSPEYRVSNNPNKDILFELRFAP
jgi:prepilin-type N-terminal cleavage/methylation domain-containing protein